MDWLSEFTQKQTLARLSEQLGDESRPAERDALHEKMLREEDRIGRIQERLARLEEFIQQGRQRIRLQRVVADHLGPSDLEHGGAVALLGELMRTQELFEQERSRVTELLGGRF